MKISRKQSLIPIFVLVTLLSLLNPSSVRADVIPAEREYVESLKNNKTLLVTLPILGISLIGGVLYWKKSKNVKRDEE
ncbi:MAG: hypothetical protein AAFQ91_15925 [Cyanobacteria bacterium J06621_15]